MTELEKISAELHGLICRVSCRSRIAHLGTSLSCADLLSVLYFRIMRIDPARPDWPDRDRFLLSKGHGATALYSVLALRGFFPQEQAFLQACRGGVDEHPVRGALPGIENTAGSLGHALAIASGILLAARLKKQHFRTFVLMGDGELNEGSVWEAAAFAAARKLDRLCVIVDANRWQATGRTSEITDMEPIDRKFSAFGWDAVRVDGHDLSALENALSRQGTKPLAVIADTVKGHGVDFMEDDNNWHYRILRKEELENALHQLGVS